MSYKDRTFCNAKTCAKFSACDRALTREVQDSARIWWLGEDRPYRDDELGAPICITGRMDCYESKEAEK